MYVTKVLYEGHTTAILAKLKKKKEKKRQQQGTNIFLMPK